MVLLGKRRKVSGGGLCDYRRSRFEMCVQIAIKENLHVV